MATATTVIVATPKGAKVASAVKNMPAIATSTVKPETSTERPVERRCRDRHDIDVDRLAPTPAAPAPAAAPTG